MFLNKSEPDFPQKENKIITKCRGCLTEEPDMNSLFINFEESTTLAEIIKDSIGYEITKKEGFSEYLCKECTKIIVNLKKFITTFQEATEYFKNFNTNVTQNTKDSSAMKASNCCKDNVEIRLMKESELNRTECIFEQCNIEIDDNLDSTESYKNTTIQLGQKYQRTKKISCEFCDEHFRSKVQLQRHKKIKHRETFQKSVQEPPKDIKKSDISVKNTSTCLEQVSVDLNSKTLCKVCKNKFPVEEFEYHFETHKTHICKTCGHKFIRKTDLNDHQEIHLDVCKYVCQHCGKAFKVRTALNKHKRIHTNPREQICDVCGQRFNTRDTLKTHYKLKHIKSKDFQCNLCGLAFTLKSTLEKHIERHNPNRQRIFCNLCNVSYINKYNLSRHHVIKHTAFETRPTCDFCGKGYIKKVDLVKHIKKHHGQHSEENLQRNEET